MLIAFKIKLALACVAGLAGPLAVAPLVMENDAVDAGLRDRQASSNCIPVRFLPRQRRFHPRRQAGRRARDSGQPRRPLLIMQHQVVRRDYQLCVDDGACRALDRGVVVSADRPAVQVSWRDANGYAIWLSRKTGEACRLPTDEEWAFAAGGKFKDDGTAIDDNDPSKRWIARYEREADRAPSDAGTRTFGAFGSNENGLQDVGGNVWEWTATCFVRHVLDDAGNVIQKAPTAACASSRDNIAPMSPISSGTPGPAAAPSAFLPDNLGFRLVVERDKWSERAAPRRRRRHDAQILALTGSNHRASFIVQISSAETADVAMQLVLPPAAAPAMTGQTNQAPAA